MSDIVKLALLYLYAAKVKPILMYHGTYANYANSIISQGLVPNPKNREWKSLEDGDYYTPSRASLQGVYLTDNFLKALGAPRDSSKDRIICLVLVNPNAVDLDEDMISIRYNLNSSHSTAELYFAVNYPDLARGYSDYVNKMKENFVKSRLELVKNKHPEFLKRFKDLLEEAFVVSLNRTAAYITQQWDIRSAWNRVTNLKDPPSMPDKAEAERNFKIMEDKITKFLKMKTVSDNDYIISVRSPTTIGQNTTNKLVAIFRYKPSKFDSNERSVFECLFPKSISDIPRDIFSKFVKDVRSNVGDCEIM